jgi:superkiller protein 3
MKIILIAPGRDHKAYELTLSSSMTVAELILEVQQHCQEPTSEGVCVHDLRRGVQLNPRQTLAEAGVEDGSALSVSLPPGRAATANARLEPRVSPKGQEVRRVGAPPIRKRRRWLTAGLAAAALGVLSVTWLVPKIRQEIARRAREEARKDVERGTEKAKQRDWDWAAEAYRDAIREDPDYAAPHYDLATVLQYQGDYDSAVTELREAVRLKPDNEVARQSLAWLTQWAGHWDRAKERREQGDYDALIAEYGALITLIEPEPDDSEIRSEMRKSLVGALNDLVETLDKKGYWESETAAYRDVVRLKPDNTEARQKLGWLVQWTGHWSRAQALRQHGQYDGAIAEYGVAIHLITPKPDDSETGKKMRKSLATEVDDLGDVLARAEDWELAAAAYGEATQLDPDNPALHEGFAWALQQEHDYDGEFKQASLAINLSSDRATAHNLLGNALYGKGDLQGAIEEYRKAIGLDSNVAVFHRNLAGALSDEKDYEDEIQERREVTRLTPNSAVAHNNLGAALEKSGALGEALGEYRRASELDPDNGTIRGNYDRLLKQSRQQQ